MSGNHAKKLEYIDGMKGLGALMVYLCHFVFAFYYGAYSLESAHTHTASGIEIAIGKSPLNLLFNGNFAVRLFLVLSGYVLCLGYFRTREKKRLVQSAKKRYFRLITPIVVVNLLVYVLMKCGAYLNSQAAVIAKSEDWFYGFNHFPARLSEVLFESFIGCFLFGSNQYNGVLWTIPYLFLGAFIVYLAAYLVGENPLRYVAYGVMLLVSIKTDFAGVIFGFVLCDFMHTQERWVKRIQKYQAVPILSFLAGLYLASYPSMGVDLEGTIYGILGVPMVVTFHLFGAVGMVFGVLNCTWLQKFFSLKPFLFLGKVSYSLYLLHFPVIATFSSFVLLHFYKEGNYNRLMGVNFILTTGLVLLLSWLSFRYVERLGQGIEAKISGFGKKEKK